MDNRSAFLRMIAWSEIGPDIIAKTDQGYNVLVGSTLDNIKTFDSYADHPRLIVFLPRLKISSTAAGAYQIREGIYDYYRVQLRLPDFSPQSQDKIALQLIKECRALDDIDLGETEIAISLCSSRWASLPGNDYGQRQNTIYDLLSVYERYGGKLA